jgi:RNA polymerase sigma-70 factor (ECF subfamily)
MGGVAGLSGGDLSTEGSSSRESPSKQELEVQVSAALARCVGGDRKALRVIYDLEAARMVGVAMRILRRRELAEEAVHEAFIRIWRGARGFDSKRGAARTWVYTVVRNQALTMLRDEKRFDAEAPDESSTIPDPENSVSLLAETSALRRCLQQLDARRRAVVVFSYVHGLSHGELAGRLGVPLGTAKSWVRRGLTSLQECMG